jgi:hypothetical protein
VQTGFAHAGLCNGLSRMKGNFHVRFLGEGVAAMPLSYPTGQEEVRLAGFLIPGRLVSVELLGAQIQFMALRPRLQQRERTQHSLHFSVGLQRF